VVNKVTIKILYTKKYFSDEVLPVKPNRGRYGTLTFFKNSTTIFFLPGERLVCIVSVGEEQWGDNYDEVFIVPGSVSLLNDFVTIAN